MGFRLDCGELLCLVFFSFLDLCVNCQGCFVFCGIGRVD